jgi:hypothetical protein
MAEAWVVSENVGDGGPGDDERFGDSVILRSERFLRGMTAAVRQTDVCCGQVAKTAMRIHPFLAVFRISHHLS